MQNWRLDDILSSQSNNTRLVEGLKLLKQRATLGSLASSDDLEFAELCRFRQIYRLEIEDTITGTEPFPGEMMSPKRMNVALPDDIYDILVEYYNDAYDFEFVTIAKAATERSGDRIVVRPQVNQFGRIRVGSEIFGSVNASRYLRSSFIRAKFVQENDSIEVFPGQVRYYFEHEVNRKIHRLAYVRWFKTAPNHQIRFHFQINDDAQSCNVELWSDKFFDISRDCIIPVHNILDRFIPCSYEIGKRNPITCMAVIPLGKKFHM
jgi:hypothetical protein